MSGRRAKPGRTASLRPPEGQPWVWVTSAMLGARTFRALGINARRILDFLMVEHASHAGRENGNLAAPYQQLAAWGVTLEDARKGLEELYATGFVELIHRGQRQAGGGEPSRYALTWLPTMVGSDSEAPPSQRWLSVIRDLDRSGVSNIPATKRWLRAQTSDFARRPRDQKQTATPHLSVTPLRKGAAA